MRSRRHFIENIKDIASIIDGGQKGAMFFSILGIASCILAKGILKWTKKDSEENEKSFKIINTWFKFNIVYFLVTLISIFIIEIDEKYNTIIFFSITIVSILVYILIKKIWNTVIKKEE